MVSLLKIPIAIGFHQHLTCKSKPLLTLAQAQYSLNIGLGLLLLLLCVKILCGWYCVNVRIPWP